ncbi:MAG: adenine nucleotide alpha hydrolase [Truepera sp.]|nr:adenine nucleotide alpha hydrolase [Truepera sp.]
MNTAPAITPVPPLPVLVSWSSGKDSAWALHTLRQQPERYDVRGIFTTVTTTFNRVSIHSTPRRILILQSERLGLPLYEIPIPYPCSNAQYEAAMQRFLEQVQALPQHLTVSHVAFGDLFLEDIRRYREERLSDTGITPLFPIWGEDTADLAKTMIASGVRAIVTAGNPLKLPSGFVGRWFDRQFLTDLPSELDPLGENGEFHTCVVAGPMFTSPIEALPGRIVQRQVAPVDDNDGIHSENPYPTHITYADIELQSHGRIE